ncbi:ATP-dependent DNA/RNA helicase [Massospora cicadina]|nr:ATP-dependent DNA/RNA helicase [Massospora cicadina]
MGGTTTIDRVTPFELMGLDDRLLRALAKLGHTTPTLVQSSAIPLALKGKDLLARAKTGSGKTLAYLLPLVHQCLYTLEGKGSVNSLILVPTRELAEQVNGQLKEILNYCPQIRYLNVATDAPEDVIRYVESPLINASSSQLKENPHIVIGTPSKVLHFLQAKALLVKTSLRHLVVDEADLALSFGYEQDVHAIMAFLPKMVQAFIMSATIDGALTRCKDVDKLKQLVLRNPVVLKLEEAKEEGKLMEYGVECTRRDKFLLLFVILKLQLIRGKCLVFVDGIESCYRVKLFLDQFGIRSCVLNSELPLNSRYHVIQEFNRGVYDYIIATDECALQGERDSDAEGLEQDEQAPESKPQKRKHGATADKEYGVSRGIDFKNVAAVINFDFPASAKAYTHRIGRTARGGKRGMSLSLVATDSPAEVHRFELVSARRKKDGYAIQPYQFDMRQVDGFRYRAEDALSRINKVRIRDARQKELRREVLNSEKLKSHFEDRPQDLDFLRHDRATLPKLGQEHLKSIPNYLMPKLAPVTNEGLLLDGSPHRNPRLDNRKFKRQKPNNRRKRHDPLKTFSAAPLPNKRSRASGIQIDPRGIVVKGSARA